MRDPEAEGAGQKRLTDYYRCRPHFGVGVGVGVRGRRRTERDGPQPADGVEARCIQMSMTDYFPEVALSTVAMVTD